MKNIEEIYADTNSSAPDFYEKLQSLDRSNQYDKILELYNSEYGGIMLSDIIFDNDVYHLSEITKLFKGDDKTKIVFDLLKTIILSPDFFEKNKRDCSFLVSEAMYQINEIERGILANCDLARMILTLKNKPHNLAAIAAVEETLSKDDAEKFNQIIRGERKPDQKPEKKEMTGSIQALEKQKFYESFYDKSESR